MKKRSLVTSVGVLTVALLWPGAVATAAAANLFANVTASGGLIGGSGVTGVAQLGPGQYEVSFDADVSQCAYVATTANWYSQALQVFTAGGHLGPNGVYVETKNQGGGLTDGPFHLVVVCDAPHMNYAVVGYSSNLVRATPGATLRDLGWGRYTITFPEPISSCAYVATVGDPGRELVYYPSGVYTASGRDSQTVYIETKNPGGGLQSGVPFHLAVICPSAPNTRIAVVNDSGLPERGSPLTSSFNWPWAAGEYVVVTDRSITPNCATVATRGSVNHAVPYSPATVELSWSPASNAIGFQVRDLLFFGGGFTNQAFHAAIVCE